MLWIVFALTIVLVSTGLAVIILQRRNVSIRLIVAVFCGYITIHFAAEPITKYAGFNAYDGLAFTVAMVMVSVLYFYLFTQHGFVLGIVFQNTVPLIQPIPQVSNGADTTLTRNVVQFNTQGAKTIWEM